MSQIEVPDWVVEVAARVVAKNVGEDYGSLGQFTQDTIKATQRECITAALGAWVVQRGTTYYDIRDSSLPTQVDWEHPEPESKENVYTLRQEKPE